MGVEIDAPEILVDRGRAAYKILHEAGIHGDKHGQAEGLLVLFIATVFACQQYHISPRKLQSSLGDIRKMITTAQKFCGKEAGVAEVVTEIGLA